MSRSEIFAQIDAERVYQDGKWGVEFDNANTPNDWAAYINLYMGRATAMENRKDLAKQREAWVKVATLAVAAVEAFDRNGSHAKRHYDV